MALIEDLMTSFTSDEIGGSLKISFANEKIKYGLRKMIGEEIFLRNTVRTVKT